MIELGIGLVGIGRAWGVGDQTVPDEAAAQALLQGALALGIRLFDTAPAYGSSEARVGRFLAGLDPGRRAGLIVATKCGEHWDADAGAAFVDHGYPALRCSIDQSLERLDRIDLLQVHKASVAVLDDPGLARALDYARAAGVPRFGASVSDLPTALRALGDARLDTIQLPFNSETRQLLPAILAATAAGNKVLVNRPFASGRLVAAGGGAAAMRDAYAAILAQPFQGFVLSGTRSPRHLAENLEAFAAARGFSGSPA